MPSHTSLPSSLVDSIFADIHSNRCETNLDLEADASSSLTGCHLRHSLPATAKQPPACPGPRRSAAAASALAVRQPYLGSFALPRGPISSASLAATVSAPSSATAGAGPGGNQSLSSSSPDLRLLSSSWPALSTPLDGGASPRVLAANTASSSRGSLPLSSSVPVLDYTNLDHPDKDDFLSALPASHSIATAASTAALSVEVGCGSGPASGPRTTLSTARSNGSPRSASAGHSSEFPFPRAVSPHASIQASRDASSSSSPPPPPPPPHRARSPLNLDTNSTHSITSPRSASDYFVTSLPQEASDTAHSLPQQLSFLIQAWMADHESCKQATRQVEDELRRTLVAMDNGREEWKSEKTAMEQQLDMLRAHIDRLQMENTVLRAAVGARTAHDGIVSFPRAGQQHPSALDTLNGSSPLSDADDPAAGSQSSNPSQQSSSSKAYVFSPPMRPDAGRRHAHFATPGSSGTSPSGAPVQSHATSLEPRQCPRHSATADFMDPLAQNGKSPVPVIDVQEIDPKLEGIPIKAHAIQKCTFTTSQAEPSSGASTQNVNHGRDAAASRRNRRWPPPQNLAADRSTAPRARRTSSRDQTLQVLAAEESRRLTMHAGHTPNHSLSLLPTMTAAGGDSTDCQSAGATLSAGAQSVRTEQDEADLSGDTQAEGTRESQSESDPDRLSDADEAGEYPLEPHDDVPLKGPLMIRNIPAQDELFFARLDRKLESVVSGQDSVPSVLRAASPDPGAARAPPAVAAQPRQPAPSPPVGGGDASQDTGSTPENEETDLDPEVPLRLKTTSNFGAPFGEA